MKQILMICCLIAASITFANAQTGTPPGIEPVSKSEYFEKVKEFKKLVNKEKVEEANAKFDEVNHLIVAELGIMRSKIRDCKDEAEKEKLIVIASKQRALFSQALKMKQETMLESKKEIIEKLNDFGDTIQ